MFTSSRGIKWNVIIADEIWNMNVRSNLQEKEIFSVWEKYSESNVSIVHWDVVLKWTEEKVTTDMNNWFVLTNCILILLRWFLTWSPAWSALWRCWSGMFLPWCQLVRGRNFFPVFFLTGIICCHVLFFTLFLWLPVIVVTFTVVVVSSSCIFWSSFFLVGGQSSPVVFDWQSSSLFLLRSLSASVSLVLAASVKSSKRKAFSLWGHDTLPVYKISNLHRQDAYFLLTWWKWPIRDFLRW